MKIPITFLGTGQAVPTAKRNHTAILLSYGPENILVDCGEGTQRQFRKARKNLCKLTRLLITHWHGDHILGLPGLFQTLALNNYKKTLQIYGPHGTRKHIGLMYRLFVPRKKIKIQVKEITKGKVFETKDFIVLATQMKHGTSTLAYSIVEKTKIRLNKQKLKKYKIKGKVLAKLAQGKDIIWKGKKIKASQIIYKPKANKITIILDTAINPNAIKLAKDSSLLICESTYSEKEKSLASEYKHLTAKQAATIAKKAKVKKLILTHLSQRYEKLEKQMLNEAKKVFKNTTIAKDLDEIEV